jgi:hypothetical protein
MSHVSRRWRARCIDDRRMSGAEHVELSRGSIAALAVYVVALAGLMLYVGRRWSEHPGLAVLELLGFPVLILLTIIVGRRGRRRLG